MSVGEHAVHIGAGWTVLASEALRALSAAATAQGAVLIDDAAVAHIDRPSQTVCTEGGLLVQYKQALVLATGAWTNSMLALAELADARPAHFLIRPKLCD